jgi:hypothetical protein
MAKQFARDTKFGNGRWLYGGANESDSKAAKAAGHELVSSLSSSPSQLPHNEWE